MVMERDLTWGGEHTIQCTDKVLQMCIPETYIILLTNVTPINMKNEIKLKSTCTLSNTYNAVQFHQDFKFINENDTSDENHDYFSLILSH